MWPFIPWENVDVSASIAACGALIAAFSLFWNVVFSMRETNRQVMLQLGMARVKWLGDFRLAFSTHLAAILVKHRSIMTEDPVDHDMHLTCLTARGAFEALLNLRDSRQRELLDAINQFDRSIAKFKPQTNSTEHRIVTVDSAPVMSAFYDVVAEADLEIASLLGGRSKV